MSADGKSFTFKGTDFGGASYNLYCNTPVLPRMPMPRVNVSPLSQANGVVTQGSTFDETRITVECATTASDTAAVETQMTAIVNALRATQAGPGTLIFDAFPTRAYDARLVSAIDGQLGLNGESFTLEFIVPSGWHQAASESTTGATSNSGTGTTEGTI